MLDAGQTGKRQRISGSTHIKGIACGAASGGRDRSSKSQRRSVPIVFTQLQLSYSRSNKIHIRSLP